MIKKIINGTEQNVSGGGGGASEFSQLTDVNFSSLQDGDIPQYNDTTDEWENVQPRKYSNRNYFLNPFFTVNQRAISSYSVGNSITNLCDMWQASRAEGVVSDGQITFAWDGSHGTSGVICQKIEDCTELIGKEVTVSAIVNGNIVAYSFTLQANASEDVGDNNEFHYNTTSAPLLIINYYNYSQTSVTITGMKLELGSLSTLAYDTAPNYTEELLKCQKYLKVFSAGTNNTPFGLAQAKGTTEARMVYISEIPMRITPTLSTSGTFFIVKADGSEPTVTNVAYTGTEQIMSFTFTTTGLTSGECVRVAMQTGAIIILSAEL
jgi:hypothetical protein